MLKATTGFTCSLLLFFFFSILKSPNFPSQRPNSFSAFSLTPGLQLTLQAYFLFPCLPQIFSVFLHLLSSLSPCIFCLSSSTTSQHLHPSPSPLWAAVGLLDSRSHMLSSSRAKPEQRAHWAEQRHNGPPLTAPKMKSWGRQTVNNDDPILQLHQMCVYSFGEKWEKTRVSASTHDWVSTVCNACVHILEHVDRQKAFKGVMRYSMTPKNVLNHCVNTTEERQNHQRIALLVLASLQLQCRTPTPPPPPQPPPPLLPHWSLSGAKSDMRHISPGPELSLQGPHSEHH